MILTTLQYATGGASGLLVGMTLGLFGGGGSILAVPMMVYLVGVPSAHMAIGTSAFAVAVNAAIGLASHARHGSVRWRCAAVFAIAGIVGALGGSTLGKMVDGEKLLFLFAILMLVIGLLMFRHRHGDGDPDAGYNRTNAPKLALFGAITGGFSGFFGIGGGFLIVPALIAATGMTTLNAIGTSLVAVTAFGLTTAANYAVSGYVDWWLAGIFIVGGLAGGIMGERLARYLANRSGMLRTAFSSLIFTVAIYMGVESYQQFGF